MPTSTSGQQKCKSKDAECCKNAKCSKLTSLNKSIGIVAAKGTVMAGW